MLSLYMFAFCQVFETFENDIKKIPCNIVMKLKKGDIKTLQFRNRDFF